jgi:hypothetical protein
MSKSYYDLLGVAPAASTGEIKKSFRREIAKYHPDKVQHLGQEFQEIAAIKAAELTQAYKTLTDAALRAAYDAQIGAASTPQDPMRTAPTEAPRPVSRAPASSSPSTPLPDPESAGRFSSTLSGDRKGVSDLVQKAAVARFRYALNAEFSDCKELRVQGFDVGCLPPKPPFWNRTVQPYVLARVVGHVDGAAVTETWAMASKLRRKGQRDICVFLMGPAVAAAGELAAAIGEQRRRPLPGGGKLIMVPVNARSWAAHVPNDAPPVVKSLLTRLQGG